MFHSFMNAGKDLLGIISAVLYRSFNERNWSSPQPMFNVLEISNGKEREFETFLSEAQKISGSFRSPVSLGPYKTVEGNIYIYVTHYASTGDYLKVMGGLLSKGVSKKRTDATLKTSWTYSKVANSPGLPSADDVYVIGTNSQLTKLTNFLHEHNIEVLATVAKIHDVRGTALDNYIVIAANDDNGKYMAQYVQRTAVTIYKARKLASA